DFADERAAAEITAEVSLLVAEGHHVHAKVARRRIIAQRARRFERQDHAERAVEPAGLVLAFDGRAGAHLASRHASFAKYVADAVDAGVDTGFSHLRNQPLSGCHIIGRKGWAVHAGLVGADLAQRIEIAKDTLGIDRRHETPSPQRQKTKADFVPR